MQSLELSIEVVPIAFSEKLPDGWNPECVSRNALKTSQPRRPSIVFKCQTTRATAKARPSSGAVA
jgi:hypothetical protein